VKPLPGKGLYAITSDLICRDLKTLLTAVEQAIAGGVVLLQYRDKLNEMSVRLRHAVQLQKLCAAAGVPLIINDGPADWVASHGFDGMHLGEGDGAIRAARAVAPQAIIGATCGNSLAVAEQAAAEGASYVAFGAFHPSRTKPLARQASPDLLRAARGSLHVPICAIGGITPDNAAPLIAAGTHYIAAINGVFGAGDITAAARRYAGLFKA